MYLQPKYSMRSNRGDPIAPVMNKIPYAYAAAARWAWCYMAPDDIAPDNLEIESQGLFRVEPLPGTWLPATKW
jgi:hypothetical protein